MNVHRAVVCAIVGVCLFLTGDAAAGNAEKSKPKARKKTRSAPAPALPTGAKRDPDRSLDAYYGGPKLDTITEYQNDLGQTVYSIAASHFDVSRPLTELAAAAIADHGTDEGEEREASEPQLPSWRIIRSDLPDPVVQAAVQPADPSALSGVPLAAPTTGFNFLGVGVSGGSPSDCNGSVGNNQFVETVNSRYQVWSLNYTTQVATSVLGPVNINSLWAGFGGACETQNSGDPIVIFDKTARRWLISQFTSSASAGVYYQCVAVSTTANAIGTYARWAFAVPSGKFGDYPHISAWPNASYFMMAHGFGGTFVALFAAMDRAKMVAGNPTATWVVIQDPNEGGHMPADLDGFALPPSSAPGVFVSLHADGMYIYRMKPNFVSPGATTKTLQAIVPLAPATAACGGGTCIPQPGAGSLDAISDRLMFRAAYRNFIDHESLVVSHSVDPSVSGVASGVRWYDIRLSGPPDPACPTYPCVYQQGTIADVANGRSRWMPSIAMDTAENILVGYTTSGKTNGSENHSSRYTGRAKGDPPGTMTAPEATVVTGTANNAAHSRWGDYFSMSSDPTDDCTFWFVSQYYTTQNQWSTRIASAVFPPGTGPGQCPVTTCTTRPPTQPTGLSATSPGDNQITVSWTGITPTPGSYAIERAEGTCGTEGLYKPLGATLGTTLSFTDTTVMGGIAYSYRVRAAADAAGKCQSILASPCVSATATGLCSLKPSFAGATAASDSQQSNCGMTVSWTPAVSGCPLTPSVRYNIFRGTVPDFVPSISNRIATCVLGPSSYLDTDNLQSGTTYYYVVRAEDASTGNGGECGGGNEEANSVSVSGTPHGAGIQAAPGTWTDGGGDLSARLQLNVAGGGNTGDAAWRFVKTTDDPGANHTPGGGYAYRNAGPAPANTYATNACAELRAPSLTAAGAAVNLEYWERHQVEYRWDAVAVEYSVNGGAWNDVSPPSNSPAEGCAASDDTTGWEPLGCTQGNGCGYTTSKLAFSGPLAGGSTCSDFSTSGAVSPYAHRCHRIAGLSTDDSIRFRWRFSSDEGAEFGGFYLDDIAVTNVRVPNACVPDTCAAQADGTSCDDGDPCTAGDTCGGGSCASGSPVIEPPETDGMSVAADKATYTWSTLPSATRYDVVRGSIGAFPVGPGGGDETCFADLASPSLTDSTPPAPESGFWYLSRGESACGTGSYGNRHDATPRVTTTCP